MKQHKIKAAAFSFLMLLSSFSIQGKLKISEEQKIRINILFQRINLINLTIRGKINTVKNGKQLRRHYGRYFRTIIKMRKQMKFYWKSNNFRMFSKIFKNQLIVFDRHAKNLRSLFLKKLRKYPDKKLNSYESIYFLLFNFTSIYSKKN